MVLKGDALFLECTVNLPVALVAVVFVLDCGDCLDHLFEGIVTPYRPSTEILACELSLAEGLPVVDVLDSVCNVHVGTGDELIDQSGEIVFADELLHGFESFHNLPPTLFGSRSFLHPYYRP